MTATDADIETQVMVYIQEYGAAYFNELRLEILSGKKPLERALASLVENNQVLARIEPGRYPNRIRYELPGRRAAFKMLPRDRYWEGDFGPPTRDAELNLEADLRMAAYYLQALALRGLTTQPRLLSALLVDGVEEDALEDLANVGLVLSGVNLGAGEPTYRLSSLGRIILRRLG